MDLKLRRFAIRSVGQVLDDALYRNSLVLLVNTLALSVFGFGFWLLAARSYSAAAVGGFSGLTSGAGILATIAALGLPNLITRHLATAPNARALLILAVAAITTAGALLCLIAVLALGSHLPGSLHLRVGTGTSLLLVSLVALTAVSGTVDAGLVAIRASQVVLVKNLVASICKVIALVALVRLESLGLLISYSLGLVLATVGGGIVLLHRVHGTNLRSGEQGLWRRHLSMTAGSYFATIMGNLPANVVPLEVLAIRGPAETARFAIAFMIATVVNLLPSTVAQVLFAEASRGGAMLAIQLRKAVRGVYVLLIPTVIFLASAAPLLLRTFGAAYASAATGTLRVLALSALLMGGTYLVDSLLIARDRIGAYMFMNCANALLVLVFVGLLVPDGLTAAAWGWAAGQGASLALGVLVVATARTGKHRRILNFSASDSRGSGRERALRGRLG